MPTWDEILERVRSPILQLMDEYLEDLSKTTNATVMCYLSAFTIPKPIPAGQEILFFIADQDMQGFMTCSKGVPKHELYLILHLPGGDYEATKRIINYLHETYSRIVVIVPHMAMSGGTLIACGADEIYMGPYSSLGPTDPQVIIGNKSVPVGAIIREFEKAFDEVSKDDKKAPLWRERLKEIPLGLAESLNAMQENSRAYLADLLRKKNCKGLSEKRIGEIVKILNTYEYHSSHGRGITLRQAQELGLNVKNLHDDKDLEDKVLSIYHAATILFQQTPACKIIANNVRKRFILNIEPKPQLLAVK